VFSRPAACQNSIGVARRASSRDGVAENRPDDRRKALRAFARLNTTKYFQNLRGGYPAYRSWAERGLGDAYQPFQLAQCGGGFALAALLVEKLGREELERVGPLGRDGELRQPLLLLDRGQRPSDTLFGRGTRASLKGIVGQEPISSLRCSPVNR
jgi:hypothetical protein